MKLHVRSLGSVTGVATALPSGRSGPQILVEARDNPLRPNDHTGSGGTPGLVSWG